MGETHSNYLKYKAQKLKKKRARIKSRGIGVRRPALRDLLAICFWKGTWFLWLSNLEVTIAVLSHREFYLSPYSLFIRASERGQRNTTQCHTCGMVCRKDVSHFLNDWTSRWGQQFSTDSLIFSPAWFSPFLLHFIRVTGHSVGSVLRFSGCRTESLSG